MDRRTLLKLAGSLAAAGFFGLAKTVAQASESTLITRTIPGTSEALPVIGMGTSRTFDTPGDKASMAALEQVMRAFFAGNGSVIDSSPMYGEAESRVGDVLRALPQPQTVFAATKVWTKGRQQGIEQMQTSERRMNVKRFDLIAVHNLKDWQTHLDTLQQWKEQGRVRYVGITTSHGRDHREFLKVMRSQPLDFVQFSYNIEDRLAEEELLPAAQELGIATMINRPYQRGALFSQSRNQPLPPLAQQLGCTSWAQFYLKFILAHPAVTCIIPASSRAKHMADNMQANFGPVPDADQKQEMLRIFDAL
tara:strand:+ start:5703 stop:6623 length:921 start_codon:yes stop_codon:yes gene_type:complete